MHKFTIVLLSISFILLLTSSLLLMSKLGTSELTSTMESAKQNATDNTANIVHSAVLPNSEQSETVIYDYALFIVLDDAGMSLDELRKFGAFSGEYTVAIIPRLSESKAIAKYLRKKHIPYIVHLPMESESRASEETFVISVENSDEKNIELLEYNLTDFSHYIGLNNHMGSKATANMHTVNLVLKNIPNNIFVLDSRTTKHTVFATQASILKKQVIIRDVFLDNYDDSLYIKNQLNTAVTLAKKKGYAVVVGHSTKKETAEVLIEMHDTIVSDGGIFLGLDKYFEYTNSLSDYLAQQQATQ